MKILVVTQYYKPENFIINDLVKTFKQRGNEVEVLTAIPNYPSGKFFEGYNFFNRNKELVDGIIVHRARIFPRFNSNKFFISINYLSFVFFGIIKVLFVSGKFDRIFIYAPSPITVGLVGIFASIKFNSKSFLWVQDLWPESVSEAGNINNRILIKILNILTKYIYNNVDHILVQSKFFIKNLSKKNIDEKKITYLPNYADDVYLKVKQPIKKYNYFSVTFAGNVGEAQNLEVLISVCKILKNKSEKIIFIIIGTGRNLNNLKHKIIESEVKDYFKFLGRKEQNLMPSYFDNSDVMLISLKKSKIFSLTIPSKLQSYMAYGMPIVGSISGISNTIINESGAGFATEPNDIEGLADNIIRLKNMSNDQLVQLGKNSKKYYVKNFSKKIIVDRLFKILR